LTATRKLGDKGVGWTSQGVEKYNELFDRICDDRKDSRRNEFFLTELAQLIRVKHSNLVGKSVSKNENNSTWVRPRNELQLMQN